MHYSIARVFVTTTMAKPRRRDPSTRTNGGSTSNRDNHEGEYTPRIQYGYPPQQQLQVLPFPLQPHSPRPKLKMICIRIPWATNTRFDSKTHQTVQYCYRVRKLVEPETTVEQFLQELLYQELPTDYWTQFPAATGNRSRQWLIQSGPTLCFRILTGKDVNPEEEPLTVFSMVLSPVDDHNSVYAPGDCLYDMLDEDDEEEGDKPGDLVVLVRDNFHCRGKVDFENSPYFTIRRDDTKKDVEMKDDNDGMNY